MYKYTIDDARREVKELLDEGYGYGAIRIFLHDLARAKDITWEECLIVKKEMLNGKYGRVECSITTY